MAESQNSPAKTEQQSPRLSEIPSYTGLQSSNISMSPSKIKQPFPLPLKQAQGGESSSASVPPGTVESCPASKMSISGSSGAEEGNNSLKEGGGGVRILFGEASPPPRWVCVDACSLPAAAQIMALRDPNNTAKMVKPPVLPIGTVYDNSARARRPPGGMGVLAWSFDPGPEHKQGGPKYDMLYMHAYKSLEGALSDPMVRDQLRDMIRKGSLARTVSNVDDPLPPLPPPPMGYDASSPPVDIQPEYSYPNYERPSLARREGGVSEPEPSGIVARMRHHRWGVYFSNGLPSITTALKREFREMAPSPDSPMQGSSEIAEGPTTGGRSVISVSDDTSEVEYQYTKTLTRQFEAHLSHAITGTIGDATSPPFPTKLEPSDYATFKQCAEDVHHLSKWAAGASNEHPSPATMQNASTWWANEAGPSGEFGDEIQQQQQLSSQTPAAPSQAPTSSNPAAGNPATQQPGSETSGETQDTEVGGSSAAPSAPKTTTNNPAKRTAERRRNPPRKARKTSSYV